jgi:opacity protein-like surface antigen
MTRGAVFCAAVLLLSVSATAQESSVQLLLNGGLSLPRGPEVFERGWSEGFNVGGGVSFRFTRHLTVQALVNYDRFPFDNEGYDAFLEEAIGFRLGPPDETQGNEVSILSASGELKVSILGDRRTVSPYVIGGGGVARFAYGARTVSLGPDPDLILTPYDYLYGSIWLGGEFTVEGESETVAIATVGGGLDIPLGRRLAIFVEGRFQWNFTSYDTRDFVSLRAGARIGL